MVSIASRATRSAKREEAKLHEGWVEHYSFISGVSIIVLFCRNWPADIADLYRAASSRNQGWQVGRGPHMEWMSVPFPFFLHPFLLRPFSFSSLFAPLLLHPLSFCIHSSKSSFHGGACSLVGRGAWSQMKILSASEVTCRAPRNDDQKSLREPNTLDFQVLQSWRGSTNPMGPIGWLHPGALIPMGWGTCPPSIYEGGFPW